MRIVRDPEFITQGDRGAAAAIGNFDGVHLGHQAVIEKRDAYLEAVGHARSIDFDQDVVRQVADQGVDRVGVEDVALVGGTDDDLALCPVFGERLDAEALR